MREAFFATFDPTSLMVGAIFGAMIGIIVICGALFFFGCKSNRVRTTQNSEG
ncbi:MAG TPA: hypothetical protein VJ995_00360 [Geothermobacteraceae bacterium]|nr:hypothetical protein [Geothermobacteraceae bacterium]